MTYTLNQFQISRFEVKNRFKAYSIFNEDIF